MTPAKLKEARLRLGLNQSDMALLLGTVQHRVSELESGYAGRQPTRQHAAQIVVLEFIFDLGLLPALIKALKAI